jgi:hypothetical protein
MAMKQKSTVPLLLLVITMAVTIALFFYWTPEESRGNLFAFNMVYALFLELLFFGFVYVTKINNRTILSATYSVLGTIVFLYVLFGIASLLLFNLLLLQYLSVKWYFTFILLGTVTGVVAAGFTMQLNRKIVDEGDVKEKFTTKRTDITRELKYMEQKYLATLSEKGLRDHTIAGSEYKSVIGKLLIKTRFINFHSDRNTAAFQRVQNAITTLDGHIHQLKEPGTGSDEIIKNISAVVMDTVHYLDSLK